MFDLPEFFKSRTTHNPENDCDEWTMFLNHAGYGQLTYHWDRWLAHRLCYKMVHGSIPDGLHVMHRCDNPKCVNPNHLVAGTNYQNMYDKIAKGRQPNGEKVWSSKLTLSDVVDIRRRVKEGEKAIRLAEEYQVNRSCISKIVNNTLWKM
jgi:hypothetical protein